jgi:perosamine synthetase
MVIGRDAEHGELLGSLRNQGRAPDSAWLSHPYFGWNYRMDELSAALGVVQMRRLDHILAERARVADLYDRALRTIDGVTVPTAAEWARPAWFVYAVRVPASVDRDAAMRMMNERGVQSKAYFEPPIHGQPVYEGRPELVPFPLPETEAASRDTLILPYFTAMTDAQVTRVAETLAEVLEACPR